jgi:hypothetical protein
VVNEHVHRGPGSVSHLATSAKLTSPSVYHPVPELHQGMAISRDGVIPEVSADNLFKPFPLLADRLVHPLTQFLLDLLELCLHAVAPGLPVDQEATRRDVPQMKVKPRKLKVSGLPSPRCRRLTGLNHTPHATAVYASWSASPSAHATLASRLPAGHYLGRIFTDCSVLAGTGHS